MYTVSPFSANPQLRSQGHVDAGVANRSRHFFGPNVSSCNCADWFARILLERRCPDVILFFVAKGRVRGPVCETAVVGAVKKLMCHLHWTEMSCVGPVINAIIKGTSVRTVSSFSDGVTKAAQAFISFDKKFTSDFWSNVVC